ncbi:MAG: ATP-dependent RecD-like DNA helicase [bacterium]|nr:ATP-dependent RecD-like DNA helicase [bacterium]
MQPETTIEGAVERIVYANEENAWSVVRLIVRGKGEVTAVGNLLGIQPGESLRLTGRWVKDRKYGKQFRVESYLTVQPSTFIGIEKYLASGLVHGIGKELARRLVQHFGLDTLEVIDKAPGRLAEVEGFGPVRVARITTAWKEQREIRDVMVFLQGHGVSTTYAIKIYKLYGGEAAALVRENPYRLAREVRGIGFKSADRIASHLGIEAQSPQRAAAGIVHTLRQAADRGHVYVPRRVLVKGTAELLEVDAEVVEPALAELISEGDLAAVEPPDAAPDRHDDEAIFLKPLEVAERGVAELLRALTAQGTLPLEIDVERALRWFEERVEIELAGQQRRALEKAITSKVMVLTGGPGTGKTTLVKGIVRILSLKGLRIQLAAPTGRAAKRLAEATGAEAKTVHRLLEYNPREHAFSRGPDHPLSADLLIVDEASMLDVTLAYNLLKAVPPKARLILVGDVDQLPSIGPGRVLADVIDSRAVTVVRLTEIFRQALDSLIITNAHRVRVGEMPILRPADDKGDFFFFERAEPEAILSTVKKLVEKRIPRSFGFDPLDNIQVLTPMQRGLLGAANLNAELQALLNPEGDAVTRGGRLLRAGDRVMQVRNNYDLEVFNGDVGRIAAIDFEEDKARVDFDSRRVDYDFLELDELILAYACSIHKSQGSEYPCVIIPLHTQHFKLLQRNLIYTALTRGRRLVLIVGSRKALEIAVESQSSGRRATLLAQRLRV